MIGLERKPSRPGFRLFDLLRQRTCQGVAGPSSRRAIEVLSGRTRFSPRPWQHSCHPLQMSGRQL